MSSAATPGAKPQEKSSSVGLRLAYGFTIFTSAFLLFQLQPIITKLILPWFGGAAAVWSVCLLFFQTVLLFGYLYAHLLTEHFQARSQAWIHATLLGSSLLVLPIVGLMETPKPIPGSISETFTHKEGSGQNVRALPAE